MNRRVRYFLCISFLALAAFLVVGLVTSRPQDWPFAEGRAFRDVRNLSGPLGSALSWAAFGLFGRLLAWIVPLSLLGLAGAIIVGRGRRMLGNLVKTYTIVTLLVSFFALIPVTRESTLLTGALGARIGGAFAMVLGEIGGAILLITALLLMVLTEVRYLGRAAKRALVRVRVWRPALAPAWQAIQAAVAHLAQWIENMRSRRPTRHEEPPVEANEIFERKPSARRPFVKPPSVKESVVRPPKDLIVVESPLEASWATAAPPSGSASGGSAKVLPVRTPRVTSPVDDGKPRVPIEDAELPSTSILAAPDPEQFGHSSDQLSSWSRVLEDKLLNYGIEGRVTAVKQGPFVTTFEFEPAPGVRIKDITSRADDLSLAMRARSLRLIAPIPGRAVVGIEIPNPEQHRVYLSGVLKEISERLRLSGIMIALGVDAVGLPFNMNLCGAPHLLMAGTTGSGKSVCINVVLASILFQYRPQDVRLLLIDPKMVELSLFNGIPHLLHPVITDPREAVKVFQFLIQEMERRNHLLREHGVKNIQSFNSKIAMGKAEGDVERLPYIVLVLDELADLVLTKGVDFESLLSRLSNMARAVGIHMIVATQRPSVDVIDGKTKANFPARIAFRVATKVDSRTILDCIGADKLLGMGDMLYVDARHPEALRLHGAWIAEDELEELVRHWKQYDFEEAQLDWGDEASAASDGGERDEFWERAREIVLHYQQGSTSLLQRRLHVGYARAARILDQLEMAGIVGPPDGSKAREVLVREEEPISPDVGE